MNPIIRVEGLSKQYRLGTRESSYDTLRESLVEAVRTPFRRLRGNNGTNREMIWALRNLNFEVAPGEVLGIVGRNGAGKSTLLKVLSRITHPTTGRAELFGRVASLLEVGTGFHPELTGRENIYLNGAVLGMKRAEIDRKFDRIVEFSELERFLDTPVKRYSSGMYMRLAFAVASHLEPEILIIDEVLAVGDAQFQKKCLGKMSNVATQGRTVLFVSHNMIAVQSLCQRAIWLDQGQVVKEGPANTVVGNYLSSGTASQLEEVWDEVETAPGNEIARLHRVCVRAKDSGSNGYDVAGTDAYTAAGLFRCACYVPADLLNTGRHRFVIFVVRDSNSVIYRHQSNVSFEILDLQAREVSSYAREPGVVQPVLRWTTEMIETVS
jgi:homopolymeric O-antigen transport system ATP-binding protein